MLSMKMIFAAAMFIATSGLLFAEHFQKNKIVRGVAALFALVAFVLLAQEMIGIRSHEGSRPIAPDVTESLQSTQNIILDAARLSIAQNAPAEMPKQIAFGSNEIVFISASGGMYVWRLEDGQIQEIQSGAGLGTTRLSPHGQYLVQIDEDVGAGRLLNLRGKEIRKFSFPRRRKLDFKYTKGELVVINEENEMLGEVAISDGGEYVALTYNWLKKSSPENDDKRKRPGQEHKSKLVVASTTGKIKACSDDIWHDGHISNVYISHGRQAIATAGWDGRIIVWDMSCNHIATVYAFEGFVTSAAVSSAGHIVAASHYNKLKTWKLVDGKVAFWEGALVSIAKCERISFDPGDQIIACGSDNGEVIIADAGENRVLHSFEVGGGVTNLVFSQSGNFLATTDSSGEINVFDVRGGQLLARARVFNSDEWVIFNSEKKYCGSNGASRFLRVDKIRPGLIWDSYEPAFLDEHELQSLQGDCSLPTIR